MGARSIAVVMPWGGDDSKERRRAILNFKRLEYLVRNKCKVKSAGAVDESDSVVYGVEIVRARRDFIPDQVLKRIEIADIVIALLSGLNTNVIYEVAFRRALDHVAFKRALDRAILLLSDPPESLPIYMQSLVHHNWKQNEIQKRIDMIADDPQAQPELPDFTVGIPNELKEIIDRYDRDLATDLQDTLQEIEESFEHEPIEAISCLRGIVSDQTASFYPSSVVKFSFLQRGEFDPSSPAEVLEFDDKFIQLYGYAGRADAEGDRPLTLGKLLKRLYDPDKSDKRLLDIGNWSQFSTEQTTLANTIIKEYGFARASVPLHFNEKHPYEQFCKKSYLPCLVSRVIDGRRDGPHDMYLLIVYIQLPDPPRIEVPTPPQEESSRV
jgi:hypothetical protein